MVLFFLILVGNARSGKVGLSQYLSSPWKLPLRLVERLQKKVKNFV